MLRLTQKWCYPKSLEIGSEGSRGSVAVRPPSFPFLGGFFLSVPAPRPSLRWPPVGFDYFQLPFVSRGRPSLLPNARQSFFPRGYADGFGAGVARRGVIEINRGPTPVPPAVLERGGTAQLAGPGGKSGRHTSEDGE